MSALITPLKRKMSTLTSFTVSKSEVLFLHFSYPLLYFNRTKKKDHQILTTVLVGNTPVTIQILWCMSKQTILGRFKGSTGNETFPTMVPWNIRSVWLQRKTSPQGSMLSFKEASLPSPLSSTGLRHKESLVCTAGFGRQQGAMCILQVIAVSTSSPTIPNMRMAVPMWVLVYEPGELGFLTVECCTGVVVRLESVFCVWTPSCGRCVIETGGGSFLIDVGGALVWLPLEFSLQTTSEVLVPAFLIPDDLQSFHFWQGELSVVLK